MCSLSPTGNWDRRRLDLNGDGDYADAGEIDDTGTFNKANEWLTRDTDTSGGVNFTLTHDAVGNTTDDGKDYTYKYDAFGRLVEVKNRSTAALVAEYRYNGLNFRTGWHYDADADGTVETGTPGDDPWYWFAHDERWRIVATFRHEDSTAKERFVWHSAGLDGQGGSSYIDSVILRDKDANTAWTTASDGTLEERLYYAQNWRADVSLVLSSTGQLKERVKYSAYGVPYCISPADYNGDGAVDQFDYLDFMADYDVENVRADINFDGITDFFDYLDFLTIYDSGNGESGGGLSSLSRLSINNRLGYAGYQWDPSIRGSITGTGGASAGKYHVRYRVLDAGQGRWTRRDPLGYVDGASVYEYVRSSSIISFDPSGLKDFVFAIPVRHQVAVNTIDDVLPHNGNITYASAKSWIYAAAIPPNCDGWIVQVVEVDQSTSESPCVTGDGWNTVNTRYTFTEAFRMYKNGMTQLTHMNSRGRNISFTDGSNVTGANNTGVTVKANNTLAINRRGYAAVFCDSELVGMEPHTWPTSPPVDQPSETIFERKPWAPLPGFWGTPIFFRDFRDWPIRQSSDQVHAGDPDVQCEGSRPSRWLCSTMAPAYMDSEPFSVYVANSGTPVMRGSQCPRP